MEIDYSKYLPDLTNFLQKLIQAPSVNGQDSEVAVVDVIATEAKKLNLPYKIIAKDPRHPNIFIGQSFSSNKELLLVAHTDTVTAGDPAKWTHSPFSGTITDNKIFGRGAIDCKGGVALNLYILKILTDLGHPNLVKVVAVADEEIAGDSDFGLRHLLTLGLNAKAAIYTYGGNSQHDSLNIGHRGVLRFWLKCLGQAAHSGSKEWQERLKGESAIEGLLEFIKEFTKIKFPARHRYFPGYKTIATPTLIDGGSGESLVPDTAKIFYDIRLLPNTPAENIITKINAIIKKLTTPKRHFEIIIKNSVPAALSNPKDPFIKAVAKLNYQTFGIKPIIKGSGPINESYMLIKKGIPTIAGFGPTGDNFHAPNEFANLDSLSASLEFLVNLARE
ncbi:MAG: M20 family metallopeptidase [Candidatus Shapirobacteria bacterium]|jgi:acetylornithine deacetylase/succinyl-diaminopimelate desuccinylase-like protein